MAMANYVWKTCSRPGCDVQTQVLVSTLKKYPQYGTYCGRAHAAAAQLKPGAEIVRHCQRAGCGRPFPVLVSTVKKRPNAGRFCSSRCSAWNGMLENMARARRIKNSEQLER